jgi:hypothetical protein
MRKKIVLFSSILATLPAVLATEHGGVTASIEKVFTSLPLNIWNPVLAFVLVAGIINGALSLTNLGKQGGDRRGFGLISGALAAMFSIFVYTTNFPLMGMIMPYIFLIILLFIFSIVMVFVTPQDDKKSASRANGTALIVSGALLLAVDGAVATFSGSLSLTELPSVTMSSAGYISQLTPYTTLLGFIFIIWGLSKVVSSFSDDQDNPSFFGGVRNMNPLNQPPSTTRPPRPPRLEAHISGPGTAVEGTALTGVRGTASGGVSPYVFTWAISSPGWGGSASSFGGENLVHTFTGTGNSTLKLTVRDQRGKSVTKTWRINVTAPLNAILTATDPANTVIPTPGASYPGIITFNMVATGGTAPYTNYNWNFVGAAPAGAPPGAASTIINYPADFSGALPGTVITTTVIVSDSSTTPATFTATHTFTIT